MTTQIPATDHPMQLGMIGLGRMGANLVRRLTAAGHDCVVYDVDPDAVAALAADGIKGAASLDDLVAALSPPRALWIMVPAAIVQKVLDELVPLLDSGDIVVDGGNSYYRDDITRSHALSERGIHYLDCGTSGGVWGLERGYCLMIGGDDGAVERLDPIFASIAPGTGGAEATPSRTADGTAPEGYLHCGPSGAGHFVKMVHNGVEYGMMAAIAEGLAIIERADAGLRTDTADAETAPLRDPEAYRYQIDVAEVAEVWRRGAVISSWLVDLVADALAADPELAGVGGFRGPGLRFGGGTVDLHRLHRGGRAVPGDHHCPPGTVRIPRRRRLRRQGALGDAPRIRRSPREDLLSLCPPCGHPVVAGPDPRRLRREGSRVSRPAIALTPLSPGREEAGGEKGGEHASCRMDPDRARGARLPRLLLRGSRPP
jgi:6-phosphogluconate dehydrogenase